MTRPLRLTLRTAGLALLASLGIASAHAQEIPVVAIQALTGPVAFAGVPFMNAIRLAFEEANQKGAFGSAKVKLIERDNAGDKGQAINLSNQAIDRDRVVMLIGPTLTTDSVAVAPIFNERKTPMVSLATADAILAAGPWAFKLQQAPTDIAPQVARYVLDKTTVRKVAIVFDRTNEGLIEYKNFFRDPFKAGGGAVVAEEALVSSDTNFLPLVTKLKSLDVEGIYFATLPEQAGNIALQLRQAGLPEKVRFIGTTALVSQRFLDTAGKAADGAIAVSDYVTGMERPMNKAFEASYKARYNVAPDNWAATGYSAALMGIAAIKAAGPNPDREKVREALMKLKDLPVVTGTGVWNHVDRRPKYGTLILAVRDGKFVIAP